MLYRAAFIINTWLVDTTKFLVPGFLTATEVMIIGSLYTAVRLNRTNGIYFSLLLGSLGVRGLLKIKMDLGFAMRMTELSINFKHLVRLEGARCTVEDRRFLDSCLPIRLKLGDTFTVSKNTYYTIVQDIIISNLVNLLVTY